MFPWVQPEPQVHATPKTSIKNEPITGVPADTPKELGDSILWAKKLSDLNLLPEPIRKQYEEIKLGRGIPRIDPSTGQQKIFRANELRQRTGGGANKWEGSKEWDVPGTRHRILEKPDGSLGYVLEHEYQTPRLFPGPWYPEGGSK